MNNIKYKLQAILILLIGAFIFGMTRIILTASEDSSVFAITVIPIIIAVVTIWVTTKVWKT